MNREYERKDTFIQKMNEGIRGRSEAKTILEIEAEDGNDPCPKCKYTNGGTCINLQCRAYYKFFQYRWRRLQRRLLG